MSRARPLDSGRVSESGYGKVLAEPDPAAAALDVLAV